MSFFFLILQIFFFKSGSNYWSCFPADTPLGGQEEAPVSSKGGGQILTVTPSPPSTPHLGLQLPSGTARLQRPVLFGKIHLHNTATCTHQLLVQLSEDKTHQTKWKERRTEKCFLFGQWVGCTLQSGTHSLPCHMAPVSPNFSRHLISNTRHLISNPTTICLPSWGPGFSHQGGCTQGCSNCSRDLRGPLAPDAAAAGIPGPRPSPRGRGMTLRRSRTNFRPRGCPTARSTRSSGWSLSHHVHIKRQLYVYLLSINCVHAIIES